MAAAVVRAAAGRLAARPGPPGKQPFPGPAAPVRARPSLRLPLRRPRHPSPDRRVVAAPPGRRAVRPMTSKSLSDLTDRESERLTERMVGGEDEAQAVTR